MCNKCNGKKKIPILDPDIVSEELDAMLNSLKTERADFGLFFHSVNTTDVEKKPKKNLGKLI